MSESLVEENASEEKNVVEESTRVRWADLEEEEQGWRREQTAEREEIESRCSRNIDGDSCGRGPTGEQRGRERTTDGKHVPGCESDVGEAKENVGRQVETGR